MKNFCDLHVHSTFSDGTYTPTEIVNSAESLGLYAVALTDHNTTAGISEFFKAGENKKVKCVGGVELSCDYNGVEVHIVALNLNEGNIGLVNEFTNEYKNRKKQSNLTLINNLKKGGFKLDYDSLQTACETVNVNRVFFSNELIKHGYCLSTSEAFNTILLANNGYYIPPKRVTAFETIKFIKDIGATSVLAHPIINLKGESLTDFLSEAVTIGLDGIETRYSTYSEDDAVFVENIAKKYNLKQSGGSDFHGENKPDISLGVGLGNLRVPKDFDGNEIVVKAKSVFDNTIENTAVITVS